MNKSKFLGYVVGPVGASFLGFISLPIIAWFYSIEDIGRISMLQVSVSFSILLFCFGLDQAYVREYHDSENKALLLKTVSIVPIVSIVFFTSLILLINPVLISKLLYGIESFYLSLITALCFISGLAGRFLSLILRMQERSYAFSMSQLLPKILLLLFVFLTVLLNLSKDSFNLITVFVLSFVFSFFVYAWNTKQDWLKVFTKKIIIEDLKRYFYFGFPLIFGGLAMWALNVSDRIFLKNLSTLTELGIYSLAATIAGVASVFAGIFNTIWAPMIYKWNAQNIIDISRLSLISNYLLAVIYFIIVFAGLFSWVIFYILPPQYGNVQNLFLACLVGPLFYTLSEVTGIGIGISKRTRYSLYASLIAVVVSIILNILLIPSLGATGAAIATIVSSWAFLIARSELSNLVWFEIKRYKIYMITLFLIMFLIINLFLTYKMSFFIWIFYLFFGLYIFKGVLSNLMIEVKNFLRN